jgi:hypothetical protein
MTTLIETIKYCGQEIELHVDDDCDLDSALCDEPMAVVSTEYYYSRSNELFNNCKRALPGISLIIAVYEDDVDAIAEALDLERNDTDQRFGFLENDYHSSWKYYKTLEALRDGMLRYAGEDQLRVEQISTQRDRVYVVWYQDELDKYAGCKDAVPPIDVVQSLFNGECYGFVVKYNDGEEDGCWGFIGDSNYCIEEAKSAIDLATGIDDV